MEQEGGIAKRRVSKNELSGALAVIQLAAELPEFVLRDIGEDEALSVINLAVEILKKEGVFKTEEDGLFSDKLDNQRSNKKGNNLNDFHHWV